MLIGSGTLTELPKHLDEFSPSFETTVWTGILGGSFLAFYAFIGFEDMVNLAEEIKDVRRTLPAAIVATLVVTTLIYVIVVLVANLAITPAELGQNDAFLALIYERETGSNPALINLISIFAVLNGPLIQIIMALRVPYRLSA
jgi:amino acid transporter